MQSVLIVDDDVETVQLLGEALSAQGFAVSRAYDGAEALRVLLDSASPPSAVVLDLRMPAMGGWEFVAMMRSHKNVAHVPVVLLTGYDVPEAARSSFDIILRKPVTTATIVKAITSIGVPEHASR